MANITTTKIYNYFYALNQAIRSFLADFFSTIVFRIYLAVNFLVISSVWLVAYLINLKTNNEDFISLNYSVDFGVNLIGPAFNVYKLPVIGTIILMINILIIGFTYKKNRFIPHILFISSVLAVFALLMSIIFIYFINFR